MDPLVDIYSDELEFKSALEIERAINPKIKYEIKEIEPFCPECGSRQITCYKTTPIRYRIEKFIFIDGEMSVILGDQELDYEEEFEMFRCQECEMEWKNETIASGCDEFEKDVIKKIKEHETP